MAKKPNEVDITNDLSFFHQEQPSYEVTNKGQDSKGRFTKGNNFWRTSLKSLGRPKSFATPEDLADALIGYLDWCVDNPHEAEEVYGKDATVVDVKKMRAPTVEGFCGWSGLGLDSWTKTYCKNTAYSSVIEVFNNIVYSQNYEGAAAGILSASLIGRKLGLADKKEINKNVRHSVQLYIPNEVSLPEPSETKELTQGEEWDLDIED